MIRPETLTSKQVMKYMDLVMEEISPSKISSHIKGDVMLLLEHLRDKEVLLKVKQEAKASEGQ